MTCPAGPAQALCMVFKLPSIIYKKETIVPIVLPIRSFMLIIIFWNSIIRFRKTPKIDWIIDVNMVRMLLNISRM